MRLKMLCTTVIKNKSEENRGTTTTTLMRELDLKKPVREPSIIHVEIDYLSCPSLRSAINILKKNNQSAAKLPSDFEHEYDLALTSDQLLPPALLAPKTICIEDVESLFDEFDEYSLQRRESESAYASTLSPKEAETYLMQAKKLAQANQRTFERARTYLMEMVL